jgi:hypothetical protein
METTMVALATRFGNFQSSSRSRPMTEIEMQQIAPSIFAMQPHESRSERYGYIPTVEVLRGLQLEGFQPFMVAQSRSRVPGKSDFTKHLIRMRHADKIGQGGSPEVILVNSHDGTSSYQMMGGWFEFVCANGLIRGHAGEDIRVKHTGDVIGNVKEGAFAVLRTLQVVTDQRDAMRCLTLSDGERRAFARAALELRYEPDDSGNIRAPIEPERLLTVRRHDEHSDERSLWRSLNIVQENVIRGGLRGVDANRRRVRTREVTGIDQGTKLNRALWVLAEEMRKLKSAA